MNMDIEPFWDFGTTGALLAFGYLTLRLLLERIDDYIEIQRRKNERLDAMEEKIEQIEQNTQ